MMMMRMITTAPQTQAMMMIISTGTASLASEQPQHTTIVITRQPTTD